MIPLCPLKLRGSSFTCTSMKALSSRGTPSAYSPFMCSRPHRCQHKVPGFLNMVSASRKSCTLSCTARSVAKGTCCAAQQPLKGIFGHAEHLKQQLPMQACKAQICNRNTHCPRGPSDEEPRRSWQSYSKLVNPLLFPAHHSSGSGHASVKVRAHCCEKRGKQRFLVPTY